MTYELFSSYNYYYMKDIEKKSKNISTNLEFFLQKFIDHLRVKNKSKKTLISYYHDLYYFLFWYENHFGKRLEKIDKRKISDYLAHLSDSKVNSQANKTAKNKNIWNSFINVFFRHNRPQKPIDDIKNLSASSRKRKLSSLSHFFNFLIADETLGKKFQLNPVNKILHSIQLKDVDIAHTKRLSESDFKLLLEKNWKIREQLIINLLFYGGLRLAELTMLKSDDLDRETKVINLKRKGGLQHKLKIQEFSKIEFLWDKYLFSLNLKCEKSNFLFSSEKLNFEKPITERAMAFIIMRCLKKAGLEYKHLTPHSFRKGCASQMYHRTKDLLLVRDYLNHQDAKVTQTYIELF